MKKYSTLVFILLCIGSYGQNVGINTTEPKGQLDVDGNVIIRTVDEAAPADTYDYLVVNPTTKEIEKVNGNFNRNLSIAKVADTNGLSLLNLSIGGEGFKQINFTTPNVAINPGNYFSTDTDLYTVPSTGIYEIFYYFRFGTGVQASLLTAATRVGILKTVGTTTTTLDSKAFSGVNLLALVNLSISATEINSVYQLNKGDKISFGFSAGGIDLGLLGSSRAEFLIKKISD